VDGDTMEGRVALGEYGEAKWTAWRHIWHAPHFRAPAGCRARSPRRSMATASSDSVSIAYE